MKEVYKILKKKKLQVVFLFYILLLLPILTPLAENLSLIDKLAIFGVCGLLFIAILTISLFISSRGEKIMYSTLLVLCIIPGSIFLAYLLFANVMLEQNSVMSLFETNPEESKEFVAHYLSVWIIVGVLTYAAIPIVMICKMKSLPSLKIKDHKLLFISAIIIIIAIIGIERVSRSVYFINIYRALISYNLRVNYEIKTIKARQNIQFEVKNEIQDTIPQTIVVVIGESLNKHHMSLYGYQRDTNPLLSKYADSTLFIYNDIVAPHVHTIPVMRSVLSMADLNDPNYFTERPSLFELFNRADYETYFISNQSFSEKCSSSYDILLTLAKHKYNFAPQKQYDEVTLTAYKDILNANSSRNKLIIIHLMGNHMAYEFRYPYQFNKFDNQKDGKITDTFFQRNGVQKTIDRYDNSVLYNDYIVNKIIQSLEKKENEKCLMIYFSDHGEELYDYREFAGHAYEKASPAMCEIPFMVWMSSRYKEHRKDLVFETNRPYSTEDFIYSLSDIAGLNYEGYDDSLSIFSSHFKPRERFVGEKSYEEIKAKFKK